MKVKFLGTLACGALLLSGTLQAQTTVAATVTASSPTFTSTGSSLGGIPRCTMVAGAHRYEALTFRALQNTTHSATTTALSGMGGDNFLAFYQGTFDPQNPTNNLIGCNDDIVPAVNRWAAFTTAGALTIGQTYTAVFTAFFSVSGGLTNTTGTGTFDINPAVTVVYTLGGTLSGLVAGRSLVLQNNGGDNLALAANGSFTFGTALSDTDPYAVTVLTQPNGQTCSVSSGSGSVSAANVNNISVVCSAPAATVPTLSEWALITFAMLLVGLGLYQQQRRCRF